MYQARLSHRMPWSGVGCFAVLAFFAVCVPLALGDVSDETVPPPPAPGGILQGDLGPSPRRFSDGSTWPPTASSAAPATYSPGRQDWTAQPQADRAQGVSIGQTTMLSERPAERLVESGWYFRQDAYWWNESIEGTTFVKEYGPLSTLGYVHRNGIERYRFELFGGTEAYDGGAQFDDGSYEPYHDSCGTNYLGVRGEYDLLLEPPSWNRMRFVLGIGTRMWFRNLRDSITPSGQPVMGYQESWWTFYPYIGLETKESDEPGPKFFGSMRVGMTPLTYQYVSYFDIALYPRCGVTAQAEAGVRFQKFSISACFEYMAWGQSGVVRDSYQPQSEMFTIGGKVGYTF